MQSVNPLDIETLWPEELRRKLSSFEHRALADQLWQLLAHFIDKGSREFFTEWTDHGTEHIREVFGNAHHLISPNAAALMSPADVFVLSTAIFLHDIAMRFDHDTMVRILTNESGAFMDIPERWKTFCTEAQHWDRDTIAKTYGPEARVPKGYDIRGFTPENRFFVGAFLRRHHGEIARRIVEADFEPLAPTNGFVPAFRSARPEFRNLVRLAGIVAESHNTALRNGIDSAKEAFNHAGEVPARSNRLLGTHYVFLMGILRIADYAEFRGTSSQHFIKSSARLTSPTSQLEQTTMDAFTSADWDPDLEEVRLQYSTASPDIDARFRSYGEGIQGEIDTTWAVLNEYYATTRNASTLSASGLTVRRVMAKNLSGADLWSQYYPGTLRITVSDASIIYLLAGPLYNGEPRFSVREILSNSHDACSEARSNSQQLSDAPIRFTLHRGHSALTFEDEGSGMSFEDLSNFYLHVGGRVRDSLDWKMRHVTRRGDDELSYAFASRFGVGVVSLFLLGDEIQIRTRKEGVEGVSLEIRPSLRELVAERCPLPRGTALRITANPEITRTLIDDLSGSGVAHAGLQGQLEFAPWQSLCIRSFRYVPFDFNVRVSVQDFWQESTFDCKSLSQRLSDCGLGWFPISGSEEEMDCVISQKTSDDFRLSTTIVYNGIPVERLRGLGRFLNVGGEVVYLRDPSNSLRFNLQKTEFEAIPPSLVERAHQAQFKAILARSCMAEVEGGSLVPGDLPLWLKYTTFETFSLDPALYEDAKTDGLLPLGFHWQGRMGALTAQGVDCTKAPIFLVVCVQEEFRKQLIDALVPDIPTVLAVPPDRPGIDASVVLATRTVIRWKGAKGKNKENRKRSAYDRKGIVDAFPDFAERARELDALLDVARRLELEGGASGIGVVDAEALKHSLDALRPAVASLEWFS